jgi:hypothetical protein
MLSRHVRLLPSDITKAGADVGRRFRLARFGHVMSGELFRRVTSTISRESRDREALLNVVNFRLHLKRLSLFVLDGSLLLNVDHHACCNFSTPKEGPW